MANRWARAIVRLFMGLSVDRFVDQFEVVAVGEGDAKGERRLAGITEPNSVFGVNRFAVSIGKADGPFGRAIGIGLLRAVDNDTGREFMEGVLVLGFGSVHGIGLDKEFDCVSYTERMRTGFDESMADEVSDVPVARSDR